jgi:hypothetical protein
MRTNMSYGYSQRLIEAIHSADPKLLNVALGRLCLKLDIPVNDVAQDLGVSRATVYNWFWGISKPDPKRSVRISEYIYALKNSK